MRLLSILATMFLLLLSSIVSAQEEDEERDVLEISVFSGLGVPMGGITDWQSGAELNEIVDRGAKTGWDAGIDIGYFLTPKILVGINFVYTEFSIDTDENTKHNHRLFNPSLYAKYDFESESNFFPYIKGHVGIDNAKFSSFVENPDSRRFREISYDPALAFGGGVGLFYYTADYSGIFLEANYHVGLTKDVKATYKDIDYSFNESVNVLDIHAGIRILIGSNE